MNMIISRNNSDNNSSNATIKKIAPAILLVGILYFLFSDTRSPMTQEEGERAWYETYMKQFGALSSPYASQELKESVLEEIVANELDAESMVFGRRLSEENFDFDVISSNSKTRNLRGP